MPSAVVLGGTGAVGRAVALRLLADGWSVSCTGRREAGPPPLAAAGAAYLRSDRDDPADLAAALRLGCDLLVDAVCYHSEHARMLLPHLAGVGSTVMVSSKAVYADDEGRHSNSDQQPSFPVPITEAQRTVAPVGMDVHYDSREGYAGSKLAAEQVLLDSGHPVSVLRPSKIHGAGAVRPRTWVFVARHLAGRHLLPLRDGGRGVDHPSAAVNLAALVSTVADQPAARILNAADPDAPDAVTIARDVGAVLDWIWTEIPVAAESARRHGIGRTPWDRPSPVVLDTTAARALGWRPVGSHAETVGEEVCWLRDLAAGEPVGGQLPAADDPFFSAMLDFGAEDAFLAGREGH